VQPAESGRGRVATDITKEQRREIARVGNAEPCERPQERFVALAQHDTYPRSAPVTWNPLFH
jgi:hypothetical protein